MSCFWIKWERYRNEIRSRIHIYICLCWFGSNFAHSLPNQLISFKWIDLIKTFSWKETNKAEQNTYGRYLIKGTTNWLVFLWICNACYAWFDLCTMKVNVDNFLRTTTKRQIIINIYTNTYKIGIFLQNIEPNFFNTISNIDKNIIKHSINRWNQWNCWTFIFIHFGEIFF